jgi:hypothetical protein
MNAGRLQASTGLPPPAADYVSCEAGRRTCSERETGTDELCEIKWDYQIDGLVMVQDEACLRQGDKINHVRITNVARQCQ